MNYIALYRQNAALGYELNEDGYIKNDAFRMEKILADAAYEKVYMKWVEENLLGVDLEISSKPPSAEGFVPVKWRWVGERTFRTFNFFRRLDKDHEKTV